MQEGKDANMYKGLLQSYYFRVREPPPNNLDLSYLLEIVICTWEVLTRALGEILTPTTPIKFLYAVIIFHSFFSLSVHKKISISSQSSQIIWLL